jgi:PAS domain S-box-containing protein
MQVLSGVRAYVGGEALWSKGQKTAVYDLQRYATTLDPHDYHAFRAAIAVPLGDRRARLALDGPRPDLEAARQGFLQGRNHPDDVPSLISLFRRFRHVFYMARAVEVWAAADVHIVAIEQLGARMHEEISGGTARPEALRAMLTELDGLDRAATPLADAFTANLGEAARWLNRSLLVLIVVAAGLLVSIGAILSWTVLRHIREGERRYRHLLDTTKDAIIVTDPRSARVVDANAEAGRMFGLPLPQLVGMAVTELYVPSATWTGRGGGPLTEGRDAAIEMEIRGAAGKLVPVEVSSAMAVLGGRRVVHSILRDITERRRTEVALEESRRRLAEEARISSALVRVGQ